MKSGFVANAAASPKKSANRKNNLTKIQSTRKIPSRSRGTQFLGGPQPLQPAGKQVAQRMRVHNSKKSANKKTNLPKIPSTRKIPPRSRGTQFLGGRTAAPTRRKTSRATNAGSKLQKIRKQKTQPHKNPIHAQNPHHGAAERSSSADHSRSNPQENKSRNECGCRCILQNREIC